MTRRTFHQHELERLRGGTERRAIGGDAKLAAAASEGDAPDPAADYRASLATAASLPEFRELLGELFSRPEVHEGRGMQWLRAERRRRWDLWQIEVASREYAPEDEPAVSAALQPLFLRALAADAVEASLYAMYAPGHLADRINGLSTAATTDRIANAFIDSVIAVGLATSRRASAIRDVLLAMRDTAPEEYAVACARLIQSVDAHPDLAQHVIDSVIVDKVIVPGSVRRALVNLPSLVSYFDGAIRNARTSRGRGREVEIESVPEIADGLDTEALVIERADLAAFVESLPSAMRADFEAVRVQGRSAAEVARATNRSKAALSKSLRQADTRLHEFLMGG